MKCALKTERFYGLRRAAPSGFLVSRFSLFTFGGKAQ